MEFPLINDIKKNIKQIVKSNLIPTTFQSTLQFT